MTTRHDYFATYDVTAYRPVTNASSWNASEKAVAEEDRVVARPIPEAAQHVARSSMAAETLSALIASQAQADAPPSPPPESQGNTSADYDGWTLWSDVWGGIRSQLLNRVGGA